MLILGLLGMYFDAAVVFVTKSSLLFKLAMAILWCRCFFYKCNTLKMLLKPKIQITQLLANTQDSARISMGAQPPTPPIEIDKFFRRQSVLPLARAQRQRFDRISRPSDRQSSFNLQRVKTYKIFLSLKNYLSKKFIKNKHVKSTK